MVTVVESLPADSALKASLAVATTEGRYNFGPV